MKMQHTFTTTCSVYNLGALKSQRLCHEIKRRRHVHSNVTKRFENAF